MEEQSPAVTRVVRSLIILFALVLCGVGARFVASWFIETQRARGVSDTLMIASLENAVFGAFMLAAVALAALVYVRATLRSRSQALALEVNQDISFSREQFKQFYEMSPVPYLLVTPLGVIDRPNKAALRFFGVTPEALVGSSIIPHIVENEDKPFVGTLEERLHRQIPIDRMEVQIRARDEVVRWVLLSVGFLRTESSKYHVGLVTLVDITEQKELDRMKTEFTSLASHQLRSPLSTVRWYIDFLRARHSENLSPVVAEYLGYMYERNQQMIDIVNTLLNLSRIEMGRIKVDKNPCDMRTIIEDVHRELQSVATASGVAVELLLEGDQSISTDAALMRIVTQNLMSNGVRYTREGGTVTVRGVRSERVYKLTVTDTGVGIPLGEQGKIFGKLYRATNAKQLRTDGNGLGLYMSKALVEALGGSISFSSKEGQGTTFAVEVPLW